MNINKTFRFLKPYIELVSEEFQSAHKDLKAIAYYIGDKVYDTKNIARLFILCKVDKHYQTTISRIRNTDEWLDDYVYEDGFHMVVIGFPNTTAFKNFQESKYSKMYTMEEIQGMKHISQVFKTKTMVFRTVSYRIFTKDPSYKKIFERKLHEYFGTWYFFEENKDISCNTHKDYLLDDRELELPIDEEEEYLIK